ncbi:MAG: hypothetical protein WBW01_15165 [Terriglobales bacterium]
MEGKQRPPEDIDLASCAYALMEQLILNQLLGHSVSREESELRIVGGNCGFKNL